MLRAYDDMHDKSDVVEEMEMRERSSVERKFVENVTFADVESFKNFLS